ncbi:DNA topoisomerase I [Halorussus pelagicus]|uniref:DNA topoisomerase I n=1 Tax=Halorussus pelagicus TaxID=2505977 RepID=UPI000FFB4CCA|nr:DNA topoisomerase I [Halorussus pelagicus]
MELIITEKDNAARRIADILSGESAEAERKNGVNVYKWGGRRCIGLSGHVVGVDFPDEYNDWRDVEPVELIDAPIEKKATKENIVSTLRLLARKADTVTIATDYDREGELIGKEAWELVREVNEEVPIRRVRFSSITDNEVTSAFENPDELDFDLAAAGEARQEIDLIWGAALTRFLSLSSRQLGEDFISVGRVQSPTLKLIVDREREIEAFDPEDYWELFADLLKESDSEDGEDEEVVEFEAQYFYRDEDDNEAERVWDEDTAEAVFEALESAAAATVERVNRRTRTDDPPAPFNTTQFIRAAGSLGYSAQQAMSIAEDLYTAGYMTYPRTDNTVYPDDLDPEELLDAFSGDYHFGDDADDLLDLDELEPTEGDEETTDHPPIHPTEDIPAKGELSDDEWEIYELVVRRFFATVAESATWEHLKVVAGVGDHTLKANGKRLLEEGYHAVYPYFNTSENYVPDVTEGEELAVTAARIEDKQTQPPRRYGQSRLIETMEKMGIGTKCLTGDTEVLVEDGDDIERKPIAEVFEQGQVVMADGDTDIAVTDDGPTVLSLNERTERLTEREKTLVSARPMETDERVFEVTTTAGRFSATDDHPVYARIDGEIQVVPVAELSDGDELIASRQIPAVPDECEGIVATWEEFVSSCDISSKLYGVDCNEALAEYRRESDATQQELADRIGTYRAQISHFENDDKDVPAWILGELGIRPDELHGLNYDATFSNPFPLQWSPELARILGNLLGDGSVHVNEAENTVDVRYHNTDRRLIERFASDIESVFGFDPNVTERPGRKDHHKQKYQVQLPVALGRVIRFVLDAVTEDGCPRVPKALRPAFVGALFDDEGHISTDGKAFISNTDHELLRSVSTMLDGMRIDAMLNESQHKLYVRGRRNLERFLDEIPIAADEKFYRGLDRLDSYPVMRRKARVLEALAVDEMTSEELSESLNESVAVVRTALSELDEEGHIETRIDGSNRSRDGNRSFHYSAADFEHSIYATIQRRPATVTVTNVEARDYDGRVYDLTIDETAPNFAVEGGVIVHNSTRHNTIEKLYDRGYIESDPPRPTQLADAVVTAAEEFAELVVSEEMTRELEEDMTAIAEGEADLSEVADESREYLEQVFAELRESREEVGDLLQESLKADKKLGPCPESDHELLVRQSRNGSHFVGCDGYPDCEYTLPLPNTGKPLILDEECGDHGLRHVKMLAGRQTFVHGCPLCKAEEADEQEDKVIGVCPECGEGVGPEEQRDEGGDTADEDGGELAIKHLQNGSRLVGCTRYPDCDYSLPLPRRGDIEVTDERCEEHDLPELVVHSGDEPWELGCPICNYREFQARESESGSDLESLDGIGSKTAEKLSEAGIESIEDLKDAEVERVASQVQGVSEDRLRGWQAKAD